jgi:predicted RNA-binding Zn-ribbon protein involved in translation (DUF1610 family)
MKFWTPIVSVKARGLKCDEENCTFYGADLETSKENINLACPECGANLLTRADYNTVKRIRIVFTIINILLFPFGFFKGKKQWVKCDMNGTGKITPVEKTEE